MTEKIPEQPLQKTDCVAEQKLTGKKVEDEIIGKFIDAIFKGPVIATKALDRNLSVEKLKECMKLYLTVEQDRLIVKAEFIDKTIFPDVQQLKNILEDIKGIQNPETRKTLAKDLLALLVRFDAVQLLDELSKLAGVAKGA